MKLSNSVFRTYRDDPADAVIPSHKLMLRAGMIRQIAAGIYTFMQPGWRTVRKIEQIIREEMDEKGAQEIHASAITPAELWQETGRWFEYGPELWRIKDRHDRDFCLGPTHEETFTDIARQDITSYKQMPAMLYQIQWKYRDEDRPRFGLLRSREFMMKDLYSFDRDPEGLDAAYDKMYDAYSRTFSRMGLKFVPVAADTGAIGGDNSHEFTALADYGESNILYCDCGFGATDEKAAGVDDPKRADEAELPLEKKETPGTKTIEEVADFLGLDKTQTIKALLFQTLDEKTMEVNGYVAAFVRGDRQVNEIKIINALGIPEFCLEMADESKMGPATGCVGGFTGPMGLHDCTVIVDTELTKEKNLCAGACEADRHYINMNYGRDYSGDIVTDIKLVQEGDICPVCGRPLKMARGIEVGQIFKLGTKYSESMGATFLDEKQQSHPIWMGCYGIGVTRCIPAIVEQHHDEKGIIWPVSVAPYHCGIVLAGRSAEAKELADKLHDELIRQGVETVLDDRKERPGVKFNDADLLGYPIRITVGRKAADGIVEYKLRREDQVDEITWEEAVERAAELVRAEGDGRCFIPEK